MKKVYVIGAGIGLNAIETAKKVLEIKEEVEIICVENMEDVPPSDRIKSDVSTIRQIHNYYSAPPILPSIYFDDIDEPKRKGHERPYKFHR